MSNWNSNKNDRSHQPSKTDARAQVSLTPRQREIYDFVREYIQQNSRSPTIWQIANRLNLLPVQRAKHSLNALKKKGYLEWADGEGDKIRVAADAPELCDVVAPRPENARVGTNESFITPKQVTSEQEIRVIREAVNAAGLSSTHGDILEYIYECTHGPDVGVSRSDICVKFTVAVEIELDEMERAGLIVLKGDSFEIAGYLLQAVRVSKQDADVDFRDAESTEHENIVAEPGRSVQSDSLAELKTIRNEILVADYRVPALPACNSKINDTQHYIDREATLRAKLESLKQSLDSKPFRNAIQEIPNAAKRVAELKAVVDQIGIELAGVPTIKVALLGPSRHGKSTLLNAIAGCSILPMSDIKPCTASIVSLKRANDWGFEIRFISARQLQEERVHAVDEARNYLKRIADHSTVDEEPDDPRYLFSTLQRFIQLFQIDQNLKPELLVKAVADAEVPPGIQRLLGMIARPTSDSVEQMERVVEKYLSTKDIYWTIVNTCEISGPFKDWHPNLELIDVPGTNDTDPRRTAITDSLRQTAKAVAICTSDSNLGIDIESWLRNSSVLGDFLEATERSRQHLFILRTKFDAYHPEIDESLIDPNDTDSEEKLLREAIESHQGQQTISYREMLSNIAAPLMPAGSTPAEQRKRDEMMGRIDKIPVQFVSALAYEVFEGRHQGGPRQKRRLREHFNEDPAATGIPGLRQFLNSTAETYLANFYYNDLDRQLETEVDRLVRFFRQQWATLEAEIQGGSAALSQLVAEIDETILPWFRTTVSSSGRQFRQQAAVWSANIDRQLDATKGRLQQRLTPHKREWNTYHWNSLNAAARKQGIHTTHRGVFIDINQNVCSLFVDDLALSWTSYRDDFIAANGGNVASSIVSSLRTRLDAAAANADIPAATGAIDAIVTNLAAVTRSQHEEFSRQVNAAVQELESIRKPAYESIQESLQPTYRALQHESGPGCQQRMRKMLCEEASNRIQELGNQVRAIVINAVTSLEDRTVQLLLNFGRVGAAELQRSIDHLREAGNIAQREQLLFRMECIHTAATELSEGINRISRVQILLKNEGTLDLPIQQNQLQLESSAQSNDFLGSSRLPEPTRPDDGILDGTSENDCLSSPEGVPFTAGDDSGETGALANLPPVETANHHSTGADPQVGECGLAKVSYEGLRASEIYQAQKARSGRTPPDDVQVIRVLQILEQNHWKMTLPALSDQLGVPAFRLQGLLSSIQRVLNVDGQQVLQVCRTSDSAELNEHLLRLEFSL